MVGLATKTLSAGISANINSSSFAKHASPHLACTGNVKRTPAGITETSDGVTAVPGTSQLETLEEGHDCRADQEGGGHVDPELSR